MLFVVGWTVFWGMRISFLCIAGLNMTPSVSDFNRRGKLVCRSCEKEESLKLTKHIWLYRTYIYCCWTKICFEHSNYNFMYRYIDRRCVLNTSCVLKNFVEHVLMSFLCWISNLPAVNSHSNHRTASTIAYLGCKLFLAIKILENLL